MYASYRKAIEYIALNDEATLREPTDIVGLPSVQLVAYIFNKEDDKVVQDVIRFRVKEFGEKSQSLMHKF